MTTAPRLKIAGLMLVILAAFFGVISSAHALTLDEQRSYDKWVALLKSSDSHINDVKQKCGIDLPVKLDPALVTPFMAENKNGGYFCDVALEEIADTCADDVGKKAVASKIKSLSCINSAAKDQVSLKLVEGDAQLGELQFIFGPDGSNQAAAVQKFLGNNL